MVQEDVLQQAEAVELGDDARVFLESKLYNHIMGLAQRNEESYLEELVNCDPSDTKKISDLQVKARFASIFEKWLKALVSEADGLIEVWRQHGTQD